MEVRDDHQGETRGNDRKGNGGSLDNRGGNGENSGREEIGGSEWIKGRDD